MRSESGQDIKRIAMWSGPRNVSTAMLRSFGNRPDTHPHDEPFYAHYLVETGKDHPGSAEVIAHHETDYQAVVTQLLGPIPEGKSLYYQKHMAHHLLPHHSRDWFDHVTHAFLIRNPKDMLLSLGKKLDDIRIDDTGLPQQWEIFQYVSAQTGQIPPVVDGADVRNQPRETLEALCEVLGIEFSEAMLSWPKGRRATDGIWAKHWYAAVEDSTCFLPYRTSDGDLPQCYAKLLDACQEIYDLLSAHRLTVSHHS